MKPVDCPRLPFRMDAYPVDRDVVVQQPNFERAMDLSLSLCRFANDKEAAAKLGIDQGLFSKRRSGQSPWQVPDIRKVMERGQNLIPLAWLAHQYGHGLVMLETEAERRERAMREQLQDSAEKIAYLEQLVQGRVAHG
jgi:hypothetical protein